MADGNIVLLAAILFVYLSFASAYTWVFPVAPSANRDYMGQLAKSLVAGRLDVDLPPTMLDVSPYKGHVYLYWGIGNVLPQLLLYAATGRCMVMVLWVVAYCFGGVVFFQMLLRGVQSWLFPTAPAWLVPVFLCQAAFGTVLGYLASSGYGCHNQSVALSFLTQALSLFALLKWATTLQWRWATMFSVCVAWAISVRPTNMALLAGTVVLLFVRDSRVRVAKQMAMAGVMVLAVSALGCAYNYGRFGSIWETGMRDATGFEEQRKLLYEHNALLSAGWVPWNTYLYFLNLPRFDGVWPCFAELETLTPPQYLRHLFPPQTPLYVDHYSILFSCPLLMLAGLLAAGRPDRRVHASSLCLGLIAAVYLAMLLAYAWTSRRYTLDFVPAMLLLAFVGTGSYLVRRPEASSGMRALAMVLLLWSVALHWQLEMLGARKTYSLYLSFDVPVQRAHAAWPALLALVLALAMWIEAYLLPWWIARQQSPDKPTEPAVS